MRRRTVENIDGHFGTPAGTEGFVFTLMRSLLQQQRKSGLGFRLRHENRCGCLTLLAAGGIRSRRSYGDFRRWRLRIAFPLQRLHSWVDCFALRCVNGKVDDVLPFFQNTFDRLLCGGARFDFGGGEGGVVVGIFLRRRTALMKRIENFLGKHVLLVLDEIELGL